MYAYVCLPVPPPIGGFPSHIFFLLGWADDYDDDHDYNDEGQKFMIIMMTTTTKTMTTKKITIKTTFSFINF